MPVGDARLIYGQVSMPPTSPNQSQTRPTSSPTVVVVHDGQTGPELPELLSAERLRLHPIPWTEDVAGQVASLSPDVIVLDARMGSGAAIEACGGDSGGFLDRPSAARAHDVLDGTESAAEIEVRTLGSRSAQERLRQLQSESGSDVDVTEGVEHPERLEETERRYRAVVEEAGDPMYLSDLEGNIVDVNEQACIAVGYSREELLSMSVSDIDAEYASQEDVDQAWESLDEGTHVLIPGRHRRRDGSEFPVEVRATLVTLDGQRLILWFRPGYDEAARLGGSGIGAPAPDGGCAAVFQPGAASGLSG